MQQTEADDTDREGIPGFMDDGQAVIADAQPTQSLEPTDGSLHHPADSSQAAAVRRPPLGDVRFDAQPGQYPAGIVAVEASVGVQFVGHLLGPTRLTRYFREVE